MLGLPARMRVMRLQYSVAMCAARSRSSAWGIDISNVAPCTLITTLLIGGGSVSAFIPALCAVWPQEGRGFSCPMVAAAFVGCARTGVPGDVIAMSTPTHG